jgi:hypothetical protein
MTQQPEAATVSQLVDANQFDITGPIVIHYDRITLPGPPALSYKDAQLDLTSPGMTSLRRTAPWASW